MQVNLSQLSTVEVLDLIEGILKVEPEQSFHEQLVSIAQRLSELLNFHYGLIGLRLPPTTNLIQTVVYLEHNTLQSNFIYEVDEGPCEVVIETQKSCIYPRNIRLDFPKGPFLKAKKIQAFVGAPIMIQNKFIGLLDFFSTDPIDSSQVQSYHSIVKFIASRLASRIESHIKSTHLDRIASHAYSDPLTGSVFQNISSNLIDEYTEEHTGAYIDLINSMSGLSVGSQSGGTAINSLMVANTNHLLKSLLDALPIPIFWKNRDGHYLGANAHMVELAGLNSVEELIGCSDYDLPWKVFADSYRNEDSKVIHDNKLSQNKPDKIINAKGDVNWILMSKVPLSNLSGQTIGVLGAFMDITQLKKLERRLLESKKYAEKANAAKTQFLSGVSHELRTPLNAILGFSQLLLVDEKLPKEHKEMVEYISSSGDDLLALINQILNLARIESGRVEIANTLVDVSDLLESVLTNVSTMLDEKSISVNCSIENNLDFITTDHLKLKQVLYNLISNAIKYNKDKGEISIDIRQKEQSLLFTIEDNGIGISETDLKTIFDPFVRVRGLSPNIKGTGIGLTITKEIISILGGEIKCQSQLGVGTLFKFDLPITAPHGSS